MPTVRVFELAAPSQITRDVAPILEHLDRDGHCIVRGAISPEAVRNAVVRMKAGFTQADDHRRSLPFRFRETPNFQRLDIGTYAGDVYQFCRTFFVFPWNEDRWQLVDAFNIVGRFKNLLHGLPETMYLPGDERLFYGLVIHQYPRGGGFMSGHRHLVNDDEGARSAGYTRRFTVGLVMSSIGEDFTSGGGWMAPSDIKTSWERVAVVGDIVIYDDGLLHGCNTVDIFDSLDLGTLNGRLFGLVGPFAPGMHFKGGEEAAVVHSAGRPVNCKKGK